MFRKHESNKSQIITFHRNKLFVLNDGNIKSRSLKMSSENISKATAWCIINSFTVMFWYCFLYHLLTPRSRVLLEKLIGSFSQEISRVLRNRSFITAFKSAHHLSLSWARSIQSMPSHSTFGRSILILSSHLSQGLPRGLFPQVPHQNHVCSSLSAIPLTCSAHLILDFITPAILGEEYRS